jgi:hypothetical protein
VWPQSLPRFTRPVLLAWATEDRLFPMRLALRLAEVLPNAVVVGIDDSYTLVPEDNPARAGRSDRGIRAEQCRDVGQARQPDAAGAKMACPRIPASPPMNPLWWLGDTTTAAAGKMRSMSLAEHLADWTDGDVAQYELGRAIGLFEGASFAKFKFVFWTNNVLGNNLWEALHNLVRAGVLEYRDEPDHQFRWSPHAPVDGRTAQ